MIDMNKHTISDENVEELKEENDSIDQQLIDSSKTINDRIHSDPRVIVLNDRVVYR